jgi:hypothetical protein
VQQSEAFPHDWITGACEPSSLVFWQTCDVSAQGVDEKGLGKLRQHRIAADSARRRFLNQMQNGALKPLAGSICPDIDLEDGRQSVEDGTAEVWIASHEPAHKSRGFAPTSDSQRSQVAILQLLHDLGVKL